MSIRVNPRHINIILPACLLTIFLVDGPSAQALDPQKTITQYGHDVWREADGLPQNSIRAIQQTHDGYIWFGTLEGLARFDGISFTLFDRANTEALTSNSITALAEDREGCLWIGTRSGLTRYLDHHFTSYTAHDGLGNNDVSALLVDRSGTLWIGGLNFLTCYRGSSFSDIPLPFMRFSDARIIEFQEDRHGAIWMATSRGLLCFKGGKFTTFTVKNGLKNDSVNSIFEDHDGILWASTQQGGLSHMSGERFVSLQMPAELSHTSVSDILEDRDGNLWMSTWGAGVARFRDGTFEIFDKSKGLSVDYIFNLYEDREGSLWIGSNGGGLNRLRDTRLTTYTTQEGLSENVVSSVYEDRKGVIWIGTQGGGLNRLRAGVFTAYTTADGLANNHVVSILEDRRGSLWIGTVGGGLSCLKGGRFRTYTTKDGLSDNFILSIFEDHSGALWIGTSNGLNRIQDGRVTVFGTKDGLSGLTVASILEDHDGNLWFGTVGGGVNKFRNGFFTPYRFKGGAGEDINVVRAIYEDTNHVLWFGTNGGGLVRREQGHDTVYTTKQGLPDNGIHQIFEDGLGSFWLSSNKGIFRVNKGELEEVAQGKRERVSATVFGIADGMKSRECNGGSQPSAIMSRDGRIWFSTMEGVVVVDPKHINLDINKPPVIIEQLIANKTGTWMSGAEIPQSNGELEFRYTGLSLLAPEQIRFRYRLEGFDKDWVSAGSRRTAYYTNIQPGNYIFRVMACNKDGIWNEDGAAFVFRLVPHLYQSTWFRLTLATSILIGAIGLVHLRTTRLRRRAKELQQGIDEALTKLRILGGLIPICAWCKKIRNDEGYWQQIETYIAEHSQADFSHGICPDCLTKLRSEAAEAIIKEPDADPVEK